MSMSPTSEDADAEIDFRRTTPLPPVKPVAPRVEPRLHDMTALGAWR